MQLFPKFSQEAHFLNITHAFFESLSYKKQIKKGSCRGNVPLGRKLEQKINFLAKITKNLGQFYKMTANNLNSKS